LFRALSRRLSLDIVRSWLLLHERDQLRKLSPNPAQIIDIHALVVQSSRYVCACAVGLLLGVGQLPIRSEPVKRCWALAVRNRDEPFLPYTTVVGRRRLHDLPRVSIAAQIKPEVVQVPPR